MLVECKSELSLNRLKLKYRKRYVDFPFQYPKHFFLLVHSSLQKSLLSTKLFIFSLENKLTLDFVRSALWYMSLGLLGLCV